MKKVDKVIKEDKLNAEHIYKCLKYFPFWQHYQISPTLLEIRLVDNIQRLKGDERSVADSIDKEIIQRFTASELQTFLQFISHREITNEIKQLFFLLADC